MRVVDRAMTRQVLAPAENGATDVWPIHLYLHVIEEEFPEKKNLFQYYVISKIITVRKGYEFCVCTQNWL